MANIGAQHLLTYLANYETTNTVYLRTRDTDPYEYANMLFVY